MQGRPVAHLFPVPAMQPQPSPLEQRPKPRRSAPSRWRALLVGLALVAGGGWGIQALLAPSSPTPPAVHTAAVPAHAPLTARRVPQRDVAKILQHMPADVQQQMRAQYGDTPRLVAVDVWDSADQDGDMIHVATPGVRQTLTLLKTAQTLYLPAPASGMLAVHIQGIRDGEGGITLGVRGTGTSVQLPVIAPGRAFTLTVGVP